MSNAAILAKGWTFTINSTPIGGIDSFDITENGQEVDVSVFEDGDFEDSITATHGKVLKLTGKYLEDPISHVHDAGQQACEDLGQLTGYDNTGLVEVTTPGNNSFSFNARVQIDQAGGGGIREASKWGCTLTRRGANVS